MHSDEDLLLLFVNGQRETPVGNSNLALGLHVSLVVVIEDNDLVSGIRFDGVDIAVLGIDVYPVDELDLRIHTADDPLRRRERNTRRRVVRSVEDPDTPEVGIAEEHLIGHVVDA